MTTQLLTRLLLEARRLDPRRGCFDDSAATRFVETCVLQRREQRDRISCCGLVYCGCGERGKCISDKPRVKGFRPKLGGEAIALYQPRYGLGQQEISYAVVPIRQPVFTEACAQMENPPLINQPADRCKRVAVFGEPIADFMPFGVDGSR